MGTSSIWLLGSEGDWPARGELDMMEQFGHDPGRILSTTHTAAASGDKGIGGSTRLTDATNATLAIESRFDLSYNAAHALCLAALRWHGYRSGNRYIVFQSLPHTLGLGPDVWRVLDKCHKVRNQGEYEGFLNVDERLVTDLIAATTKVLDALDARGPI